MNAKANGRIAQKIKLPYALHSISSEVAEIGTKRKVKTRAKYAER